MEKSTEVVIFNWPKLTDIDASVALYDLQAEDVATLGIVCTVSQEVPTLPNLPTNILYLDIGEGEGGGGGGVVQPERHRVVRVKGCQRGGAGVVAGRKRGAQPDQVDRGWKESERGRQGGAVKLNTRQPLYSEGGPGVGGEEGGGGLVMLPPHLPVPHPAAGPALALQVPPDPHLPPRPGCGGEEGGQEEHGRLVTTEPAAAGKPARRHRYHTTQPSRPQTRASMQYTSLIFDPLPRKIKLRNS